MAAATPVEVPSGTTVKISDHTLTTDFNLSGGTLEFDVAAGADVAYTGTITGQGTVEKTGEGWLTFSGGESLTSESTLKATGGRLRFTDFASAGGATLVGNGGFFGNVAGHAIRIPSSTVVTGAPLNFYSEGDGTNVVVENCADVLGQVTVYGDSLASVVQFDGKVSYAGEKKQAYLAADSGMALLTSDLHGFDYFQTCYMGGLGGLMLGADSSALIKDVTMIQKGRLDVAGVSASFMGFNSHDGVGTPMDVILTNSAATAATLTLHKGGENHRPRYCVRDGAAGTLDICYDATEGVEDDLSDTLFQNHGLRISKGAFMASARMAEFNRPAWHTAPAVSGRYLRLVVTNCTGNADVLRIAEFRLTLGGRPVAWPAGTTATSPNPLPGPEWGEEGDLTAQAMIDGEMTTFWHPVGFFAGVSPATNVIDMTREVAFNGYQMAAGGDPNKDMNGCPSGWTLEVGRDVDGAIVWEQVTGAGPDEWIGEARPEGMPYNWNYYGQMYESIGQYLGNCILPLNASAGVETFQGPQFQGADFVLTVDAPGSLTLADHLESVATLSGNGTITLAHSRLFAASAVAFTGTLDVGEQGRIGGDPTVNGTLLVGNAEATETVATDALADTACVTVGATGRIELRHANETVGGLSGTGTVNLGGGVLTLGADVASAFDGAFAGGGTLVQKAGAFTGTATASGDYTVRLAGGRWAGRLDVSGALTLHGQLAVDATNLTPGTHTLFSFGSLGSGSEAVVASAVIRGKPVRPYRARVAIVGNAVVADVYAPLMVIIR